MAAITATQPAYMVKAESKEAKMLFSFSVLSGICSSIIVLAKFARMRKAIND